MLPRHRPASATLPLQRKKGEALNGHRPPRMHLPELAILRRLRDGLKALPDEEPPGQPPEPGPEPGPGPGLPADPAIAAIRETFKEVTAVGDEAISFFYARLFIAEPGLRDLFPPAMDEQRDRLFRALARIVESLSTPEELAAYLAQLGRDHRKYAVEPGMYEGLGGALLATLRAYAKETFTGAAAEAWSQVYAAASSMMIRAAEEETGPAYWPAEVVGHEYRGDGIAVLTVAPDEILPYLAGQHVTIQTTRYPKVWRPYSIARRPRDDGLLTFHVRAVRGGWVSQTLVHHTKAGDEVTLGPALGNMTLGPAAGRDLLCVAGGTGLSPVKAIIDQAVRDALAGGLWRRVHLFAGARTRGELYDLPDLWRLSDAWDGLQVIPVTSDDPAYSGLQGNVGRVAARHLPRMPQRDCEAYVAGPAGMVQDTLRALARAGVPPERVHYDDALLAARPQVGTGT